MNFKFMSVQEGIDIAKVYFPEDFPDARCRFLLSLNKREAQSTISRLVKKRIGNSKDIRSYMNKKINGLEMKSGKEAFSDNEFAYAMYNDKELTKLPEMVTLD